MCIRDSSRLDPAAAAKKPIRPGSPHDEEPERRHNGVADGKKNKNAPVPAKIGNLLRPCSRGDEAPRSPLGGNTKRCSGGAAAGHAGAPPAAKRKATTVTPDSGRAKRRASPSRVPIATKKQQVEGDGAASASPSPRSSDSEGTVRALLERARPASDAIRRRDIERLRAQARRELERMVRTVEFNDPFLTPQDVLR
ncbi:hypothetical protein BAE44_0025801 [Dichanthelium oligosanthes]|uniref:Uncharacterized protein n=1 Tax=Dichanthelium oligosanthes TaxID=888268 RepID=A0A1E5UJW8_9POAL|nr:hypothetical protein BAE44_0025801 [Dichanthelium oligosanthes]